MGEIETIRAGRFEWIGELGQKARRRERVCERLEDVPLDVWPGKWTDMAALERNAEAYRREARRQAFAALVRKLFRRR